VRRTGINALCYAGLAVFTLYLLKVNDGYYRANSGTPTYDEAWYLETSLNLHHRLTGGSLHEFVTAYTRAFGTKAPLIAVLPIPFYIIFGPSHYSALLVNSFFLVVSNIYLFLLVRRLFSPEVGLAAVVFYQTMPLVYGLSRSVMAEYGLAALVIVWLYYLVASEDLTRGAHNVALGVVLGFGLLMKVLFPVFIAGPLALALVRRRRAGAPKAGWPLAVVLAPAVLIAGSWYAFNWLPLLRFAWHSAYGQIAPEYGAGGLSQWILVFVNQAIGACYAAALVIFGIAALAWRMWGGSPGPQPAPWPALLTWLIPPLIPIAAAPNQLIRFVIPVLPVFAIALAAFIFSLGKRWIVQATLALLVAIYPQRLYAALSYPYHPSGHEHAVRWGPLVFFSHDLGWAHPPLWEDPWDRPRVVEALHRLAVGAVRPQYVVLGIEHVYLNANLLSYLNAYHEYPLRLTSLGYAESSVEKAVERIYALDARFLVLGEGFEQLPDFLNRVNGEIQARLDSGELPFGLRAKVALAHQRKAVIYEREAPWQSFAPGTKAPQPSHPVAADLSGGIRFLGYDWKKRDRYLWEIAYYWTASARIEQDYCIQEEFRRGDKVVLTRDHYVTNGQHPFPEWKPGEIVRQSFPVYLPRQDQAGQLEVRLWLVPWGVGPAAGPAVRFGVQE